MGDQKEFNSIQCDNLTAVYDLKVDYRDLRLDLKRNSGNTYAVSLHSIHRGNSDQLFSVSDLPIDESSKQRFDKIHHFEDKVQGGIVQQREMNSNSPLTGTKKNTVLDRFKEVKTFLIKNQEEVKQQTETARTINNHLKKATQFFGNLTRKDSVEHPIESGLGNEDQMRIAKQCAFLNLLQGIRKQIEEQTRGVRSAFRRFEKLLLLEGFDPKDQEALEIRNNDEISLILKAKGKRPPSVRVTVRFDLKEKCLRYAFPQDGRADDKEGIIKLSREESSNLERNFRNFKRAKKKEGEGEKFFRDIMKSEWLDQILLNQFKGQAPFVFCDRVAPTRFPKEEQLEKYFFQNSQEEKSLLTVTETQKNMECIVEKGDFPFKVKVNSSLAKDTTPQLSYQVLDYDSSRVILEGTLSANELNQPSNCPPPQTELRNFLRNVANDWINQIKKAGEIRAVYPDVGSAFFLQLRKQLPMTVALEYKLEEPEKFDSEQGTPHIRVVKSKRNGSQGTKLTFYCNEAGKKNLDENPQDYQACVQEILSKKESDFYLTEKNCLTPNYPERLQLIKISRFYDKEYLAKEKEGKVGWDSRLAIKRRYWVTMERLARLHPNKTIQELHEQAVTAHLILSDASKRKLYSGGSYIGTYRTKALMDFLGIQVEAPFNYSRWGFFSSFSTASCRFIKSVRKSLERTRELEENVLRPH